jgi:hypothetical protein
MSTPLYNLSEAEIEKLSYERFAYPHPMIQKRFFSVYLKAKLNLPNHSIGLITSLHPNTVAHWIDTYKQSGYESLLSNNYGTNKSEMDLHGKAFYHHFPNSHQ